MSEITDAYTSLSKYCISNPFSVLKYASFIKNCTPGWALLNQNLTPLKVNASLKSKFNTQNIASTIKNIHHSKNKLPNQSLHLSKSMHHSSQNLAPKNIASTLKNIQHSNNKLWQQDK